VRWHFVLAPVRADVRMKITSPFGGTIAEDCAIEMAQIARSEVIFLAASIPYLYRAETDQ
jgi:hypothetical protein